MANGLADHIQEWRERGGEGRIGIEFTYKVNELQRYWHEHEGEAEAAEFVVVRLVTIIEVFVRVTIASLIDSDTEYADRAEGLLKGKLDYALAKSLHGRKVTLGELVAHSLPLSNVKAILAAYEPLLPGFRKGLEVVTERWIEEKGSNQPIILQDADKTIGAVDTAFETRHILVHELPQEPPYDIGAIADLLSHGLTFVDAMDWQITAETKGYVPRTQASMTASAGDAAASALEKVQDALAALRKRGDMSENKISESQEQWERFADADARLYSSLAEGGSMESMLYYGHQAGLAAARLATIESWLSREEGF